MTLHHFTPNGVCADIEPFDDITDHLNEASEAMRKGGPIDAPWFPWRVSGRVTIYPRQLWRFHGPGAYGAFTDDAVDAGFVSTGYDDLVGTGSKGGAFEVWIRDLVLDGNSRAGATGHGLRYYGASNRLQNVDIRGCSGAGIHTEYARGGAYGPVAAYFGKHYGAPLESRYTGLTLWDNVGGNLQMDGPHDSIITDLVGVQQHVPKGTENVRIGHPGYDKDTGSAVQGNLWHLWGGDPVTHLDIKAGACRFTNIVAEGAQRSQIRIESSGGVLLEAAHVFGQDAPDQVGIELAGCQAARITGRIGGGLTAGSFDTHGDWGNNQIEMVVSGNNPMLKNGKGFHATTTPRLQTKSTDEY